MTKNIEWSADFCITCNRKIDSNFFCSEACRIAKYMVASSRAGSAALEPSSSRSAMSWTKTRPSQNGLYLEPAYDFSKAKPYGTTPSIQQSRYHQPSRPRSSSATTHKPVLTSSGSQSSLFLMQIPTLSTHAKPAPLSDESREALKGYASSFDQSRNSRRLSTH